MEGSCEFCGGVATVYCQADSARLCLACDPHVHSANALAQRHRRTLLCHACNTRPATLWCPSCHSSLCQACDLENHEDTRAAAHKRHSLECFTGCPSATALSALWACEHGLGANMSGPGPPPLPVKDNDQSNFRGQLVRFGLDPGPVEGEAHRDGKIALDDMDMTIWTETRKLKLVFDSF